MNYILDAFAWLAEPAHWLGPSGVWMRLAEHVGLTLVTVLIASAIALPAGLIIGHTGRGSAIAVGLTGSARAISTLGILTLCGLWLGIGVIAPLVALVILAIPSLLAGAYSGVRSIDRQLPEAMRAIGMSSNQVLWRVEIPLALPVIVGGIRAATLQVVATATLAAYLSDTGLGRYLFAGLKTRDYGQMLAGALLVIGLALALELALSLASRAASRVARPGSTVLKG